MPGKPGRRPLPVGKRRSETIYVTFTPEEKLELAQIAFDKGTLGLSSLVRQMVLDALRSGRWKLDEVRS